LRGLDSLSLPYADDSNATTPAGICLLQNYGTELGLGATQAGLLVSHAPARHASIVSRQSLIKLFHRPGFRFVHSSSKEPTYFQWVGNASQSLLKWPTESTNGKCTYFVSRSSSVFNLFCEFNHTMMGQYEFSPVKMTNLLTTKITVGKLERKCCAEIEVRTHRWYLSH
jgi:hypothetical protein